MIKKIKAIGHYAKYLYSEGLIREVTKILKEERIKQHLSHEKFADMAGIHRTAIGHIENGTRRPSLYVFIKLAKALKMSASELLKRAEQNLRANSPHVSQAGAQLEIS